MFKDLDIFVCMMWSKDLSIVVNIAFVVLSMVSCINMTSTEIQIPNEGVFNTKV